jgi:cellulose synthase subunit
VPATLLPNSEFYLPRDYHSKLPDLSLLRFQLYPFSLRPDLSETFIVLPNEPGGTLISSLVELACNLGRLLPTDAFAFRVIKFSELTDEHKASGNLIFLEVEQPVNGAGSQIPGFPLLPSTHFSRNMPKVQEAISPWNSRRYLLRISASSASALRQAVALCFSEKVLGQLKGDGAYLKADQAVCVSLSKHQEIDEVSYLAHLEAWLRVNWQALPIILTIVSALLFIALRLLLTHYKTNTEMAVVSSDRQTPALPKRDFGGQHLDEPAELRNN